MKDTAYNGRFGASGAVARLKVCANLEVYCPSERQWKPRLRQAAGTLDAIGARPCSKGQSSKLRLILEGKRRYFPPQALQMGFAGKLSFSQANRL